ncbi:hypothetical protein JKP88DRAFT_161308 [Tribonema minus]|uniref:Uncharacterized protein n=1 Tax=Tribonema minus TaxID=303371 RepID=A0A836CJM3_9STRA|nr:hypothetical protein JKP88DRAFT_161308 [Tribonema minus]
MLLARRSIAVQRPIEYAPIRRLNRTLVSFAEDACWMQFRFRKEHIQRLRRALGVPDVVVLPNRSKDDGDEALLIFLHRLSRPSRLTDVKETFGREETQLSRIFL